MKQHIKVKKVMVSELIGIQPGDLVMYQPLDRHGNMCKKTRATFFIIDTEEYDIAYNGSVFMYIGNMEWRPPHGMLINEPAFLYNAHRIYFEEPSLADLVKV